MALNSNVLEYWKLDSNRTGSISLNLTANGTASAFGTGKINQGIAYAGVVDRFDTFTYNAALPVGSIAFWYKPIGNGTGTAHRLLGKTQSGVTDVFGIYSANTGKRLQVSITDTAIYTDASDRFVVGNWYLISVTWNGTTVKGYVNGTEVFSVASTVSPLANTTVWTVGGWSGNALQQPDCVIDEIGLWTQALSGTDNTTLYNGGNGLQYAFFTATTSPVTAIGLTSATFTGEIVSDGGNTVTERGFVYSQTTVPTISNSKVVASGTIGSYSSSITGIVSNTTYYVRSFATNSTGTIYGNEVSFTTLAIAQYDLQREIGAVNGQTYMGQINVTGSIGTITVKLGTTGTSTIINAGAGNAVFSGTYNGLSGLIITRSATFNGTIDNIFYAQVPLLTPIDWTLDAITIVTAVNASVFFKRIEDDVFNSFRFYRYLDLLFKDLDGYVTVTVRDEREDITTERTKIFSVGNVSVGTVSPFQKKRISFLIKNQAIIIGLSNGNIGETFSIAQFILTGHKRTPKMFAPSKIQSL